MKKKQAILGLDMSKILVQTYQPLLYVKKKKHLNGSFEFTVSFSILKGAMTRFFDIKDFKSVKTHCNERKP